MSLLVGCVCVLPAGVRAQTTVFRETMGAVPATTPVSSHETANGFDNDDLTMTVGGSTPLPELRATYASGSYAGASGEANVYFASATGDTWFVIEGIKAAGLPGLTLDFAVRKETAGGQAFAGLQVEYWDGSAYQPLAVSGLPTSSSGSAWYFISGVPLPVAAQINDLRIRFRNTSGTVRIDDVALKTTASVPEMDVKQGSISIASGGSPSAFAGTYVGASSTAAFSINNPGSVALTLNSFVFSGDFALSGSSPASVPAGGSATFTVAFQPTAPGTRTGSVSIANNDPNENPYVLNFTGTGLSTSPTVSVSAAGLNAFNTLPGVASDVQSYTVSGTNLTGNVLATAPAGYEVSLSSGSGFGSAVTLVPTGGTVANVPVYVRLTGAGSGSVAGTITHTSAGAAAVDKPVTGTVVPEPTTRPTVSAGIPTSNAVTLSVAGGNGSKRLLLIRAQTAAAVAPADKTTYTANAVLGTPAVNATTGAGNLVVLTGTATSVTVTGLTAGVSYVAEVYAYNEAATAGFENYLASAGAATFTTAPARSFRWDGGGDGASFADARNWNLDEVPNNGDEVVLDHTAVPAAYTVTLPSGTPPALSLAALVINPNNGQPITVVLPAANTAADYLRLTRATEALVIYRNGTFINSSGAGSGTVPVDVTTGSSNFIVYNGGTYVHRTLRSASALLDNLSAGPGTEAGTIEYDVPGTSTTISLTGRTYGNLTLRSTVSGSMSYSGAGTSPLVIRGNLTIDANATFATSLNSDISLGGNLINNGRFRFEPQSQTNRLRLILNGSGPQTISGNALAAGTTGTSYLGANVVLQVNNAQGVTLATPVALNAVSATASVNGGLELISGKLTTSATNVLTLTSNAVLLGTAGASSYVNGPLVREVAFTASSGTYTSVNASFPLGSGGVYRPVGMVLMPDAAGSASFLVEPVEQAAPQLALPTSLDRVSAARYYRLTRVGGSASIASASISLPFGADDYIADAAKLRVAMGEGSAAAYTDLAGVASSTAISATVPGSALQLGQANVFALANAAGGQNPLPVELATFTVRQEKAGALLQWQTATEKRSAHFEVQRSRDGRTFQSIGEVAAAGTSATVRRYSFVDTASAAAITYYRLRQVDLDGSSTFSAVVALGRAGQQVLAVYPNPTANELRVQGAVQPLQWRLLNALGQTVLQGQKLDNVISLSSVPAGAYYLELRTNGHREIHRVTKL